MSSLKKLSLLPLLLVFILSGCSRSDVTESSNDSRSVEYPSENPSTESRQGGGAPPEEGAPPPEEGTPPPEEGTPPPEEGTPPPEEGTPPPEEGTPPPVIRGGSGLFYTPEELEIWNQRRLNGPYKTYWDNRIYHNAQLFMNGQKDTAPWAGQASRSCWPVMGPYTDKYQGTHANAAGFVYRVLKYAGEDQTAAPYFNKVKNYLMAHLNVPGINFADGSRWCESSISGQGVIMIIATWARRLAITYSWIKEDMSAADRARFEAWLVNAGKFFVRQNEWHVGQAFVDRYNDQYACVMAGCVGRKLNNNLYSPNGPVWWQVHDTWNNRGSAVASSVGIIGVVTGNNTLIDKGVRFFKESLKYSVWPDGSYVDITRASPEPQTAFGYPCDYMGSMITLADALARKGNRVLYEYTTRTGLGGTESGSGQPAKSLKGVINHLAGQVDGRVKKYGIGKPNIPSNVINPYNVKYGDGSWSDLYMVPSNIYYKDNYIKTIYNRTAPGTHPRGTRPSIGWPYYTSDWSTYPDVEFMWSGLEGQVWPYGSAGERKSLQNTSPLCNSSQRNCSTDMRTR